MPKLLSDLSQAITLRAGDMVEIEIEGIGVLRNPVVTETPG